MSGTTEAERRAGSVDKRLLAGAEARGALAERVRNLETWQASQDGAIQRVERKLDQLLFWLLGAMLSSLIGAAAAVVALVRSTHP